MQMQDSDQNRAILVSVGRFYPGVPLGNRPGAARDDRRLHAALSRLGFRVEIHQDLRGQEIRQLFLAEARRPVKDCFLAVLSSHGEDGCIFGADGDAVMLPQLFRCFHSKAMETKVKVFLVQACRGSGLDDGVQVDSASNEDDMSFSQYLSVPMDTAVMYATPPGYGALMHPLGSVLLQTFCVLLEDRESRQLELTRLLTRLSHRVAFTFQAKGRKLAGKKEMPCLLSRLTREAFPFAHAGR